MKPVRFVLPFLISSLLVTACGNKTNTVTDAGVNDTTMSDPTNNALDHHPDQRQQIPQPDSSNVVGTDTITPNADSIKK